MCRRARNPPPLGSVILWCMMYAQKGNLMFIHDFQGNASAKLSDFLLRNKTTWDWDFSLKAHRPSCSTPIFCNRPHPPSLTHTHTYIHTYLHTYTHGDACLHTAFHKWDTLRVLCAFVSISNEFTVFAESNQPERCPALCFRVTLTCTTVYFFIKDQYCCVLLCFVLSRDMQQCSPALLITQKSFLFILKLIHLLFFLILFLFCVASIYVSLTHIAKGCTWTSVLCLKRWCFVKQVRDNNCHQVWQI